MITILQDAATAATNAVETGQQTQPQGNSLVTWGMLILIFVVMWFFMIRPQRKQQKELQKFRDGLKKGDKVITVGGIYGTIEEVKEDNLLISIDKDVKIRVAKTSVVRDSSQTQQ